MPYYPALQATQQLHPSVRAAARWVPSLRQCTALEPRIPVEVMSVRRARQEHLQSCGHSYIPAAD